MTVVREAAQRDAGALAGLLSELGYPADPSQVGRRLASLPQDGQTRVFVADEAGTVIGFIAMHVVAVIERDAATCRVTALAVTPPARQRGVGRALIERVQAEALRCGCDRLEVTSNERREDAHNFYRQLGFEDAPNRFLKPLGGRPPADHRV